MKFKEFEKFCGDNFIDDAWAEHLWSFIEGEQATLNMDERAGILTIKVQLTD